MRPFFRTYGDPLLVLLLGGLFLSLSFPHLSQPGLYYDEAYDAAVAVDLLSSSAPQILSPSFSLFGFRLPLKTYGWGGALKVYLYLPLFALFGPSVFVMRMMNLCVGIANVALTYCLARLFLSRFPSFVVLFLLVLDPNFIFETRLDWEPSAFAYLFRAAGTFFLMKGWLEKNRLKMGWAFFCFVLGVYNRATFHIFLIPFFVTLLVFFRKEVRQGLRERLLNKGLLAFFFLVVGVISIDYISNIPLGTLPNPPFASRAALFLNFLKGTPLIKQMLGEETAKGAGTAFLGIVLLATFFLARIYPFSKSIRRDLYREIRPLSILVLLSFALLVVLPGVRYGCHFLILYPFLHLLAGFFLQSFLREVASTQRKMTPILLGGYLLLLSAAAMSGFGVIHRASGLLAQTGGRGFWSDAIYDLADYLSKKENEEVVCLDWGFQRNLLVLIKGKIRFPEPFWPWVLEGKDPTEDLRSLFSEKGNLYLLHEAPFTKLVKEAQVKIWAKEAGFELELLKTFYQKTGEAVFSLYKARPLSF